MPNEISLLGSSTVKFYAVIASKASHTLPASNFAFSNGLRVAASLVLFASDDFIFRYFLFAARAVSFLLILPGRMLGG